jgi:hypothetical protein
MKLLSFTILSVITFSSYAVEFHSCTDSTGKTHFTNLPKSSLDSNCSQKDHYSEMFNQDYQNLSIEYAKYGAKIEVDDLDDNSLSIELSKIDISPDTVKNKVKDIFDPDKALDELMDTTEDRDDIFTRAMRGRGDGIQSIMDQGYKEAP